MDHTFKKLVALLGTAYAVGLTASRFWGALWRVPATEPEFLWRTDHLVFGGLMLAATLFVWLAVYAMKERRPVTDARTQYARFFGNRGKGRIYRFAWLSFRWLNTVGAYIAPYYLVLAIVVYAATDRSYDTTVTITAYVSALTLLFWAAIHLRERDAVADEQVLLAPGLGFALRASQEETSTLIGPLVALLVTTLPFALLSYPSISQAFGGGRPIPVEIILAEDAPGSRLFEGGTESLGLLRTGSEYVVIAPLVDGEPSGPPLLLRRELIQALRVSPAAPRGSQASDSTPSTAVDSLPPPQPSVPEALAPDDTT